MRRPSFINTRYAKVGSDEAGKAIDRLIKDQAVDILADVVSSEGRGCPC
jgi:hypothetical protein